MMRTAGFALAAVVLLGVCGGVRAASAPALIEALRANGAVVTALGERGDLRGYWVAPVRGDGYALYVTAAGYAVAGCCMARTGRR